ncbi:MAG: hypothetical protein MUO43_08355 [Desulfobacterales bacterium]|nr:hypothetical protein [Desulfobacterales bacterium]
MDGWMIEQLEQEQKDSRILNRVKNWVSNDLFENIVYELAESENPSDYRIVDEPIGKPQEEVGFIVWVNQNGGGHSGDSWAGTCCIELPNGKYLMWDYWM